MFSCPAQGTVSLLALVPMGHLAEPMDGLDEEDPVVVHITACRKHAPRVRRWLRERMHPEDTVDTYGTEWLMREWGQVTEVMGDTPILRMQKTA